MGNSHQCHSSVVSMAYFALADCNNFYVSCERVFNPALEKQPIIILSNNDGCIISRSNEAKALGIPMGAPAFKYRDWVRRGQIRCFSSNYALYGDMSQRVMDSLRRLCPDMEVYSIDEAFLKLDHYSYYDLKAYLIEIRQKVKQWTGIPISIGLASSKTLAKVANFYAKRISKTGVYDLRCAVHRDSLLKTLPIEEIWGIGRKLTEKLQHYSIKTAFDLQQANPKIMRRRFSVVIERIILELNGISCLDLETVAAKKQIMCSRSFGRPVTDWQDLSSALSRYAARAAYKLRKQNSKAQAIYVFVTTNRHKTSDRQYTKGLTSSLVTATNDTRELITAAQRVLKQLYKTGFNYKKAGILLIDIISDSQHLNDLFVQPTSLRSVALMKILDETNKSFGSHTLFFAAEGCVQASWSMRSGNRSPRYTTHWQEIVKVIA
ncbi:Y-family DNA polymerase [Rickettsiella endosymbiont of Litargus connexus]|uniref:Y-family DNA polymerase n=1 Tax=Rickettsiella endosymbiont of Litargus connexus TaxID=3066237 RepID=UPI00376F2CC1